jgi:hypothetical protein
MSSSDVSTTWSPLCQTKRAKIESAKMERRQRVRDTTDGDDGCNWDIEVLEFVVDSFIWMFPEREEERRGEGLIVSVV